jgi:hypothetical protein
MSSGTWREISSLQLFFLQKGERHEKTKQGSHQKSHQLAERVQESWPEKVRMRMTPFLRLREWPQAEGLKQHK